MILKPTRSTLFPYTTLFRSLAEELVNSRPLVLAIIHHVRGVNHEWLLRATCDILPDRKSTRLNSSHVSISYAVFCLKKKIRPIIMIRYCHVYSEFVI